MFINVSPRQRAHRRARRSGVGRCHSCVRGNKRKSPAASRQLSSLRQGAGMWETVGIPETEARVYETLIPSGLSTVEKLAQRTDLTATRISRALTGLISRGLVT